MKIFVYDALAAYYVNDEDDYKTASSYNLKALNLAEDIPELWVGLASSRCSYLTKIGDLKQVKEVHQKAMQFLKRGVYDLNDTRNLMNVLDLHGEAREYKLAEATYKELLKLVKTPRDSAILAESQYDIADYRAQQGNYKGAYEAVLEANKLQDIAELSRYTQDARVKAAETEAAFEIAQKERENLYQRRISLSIGIGLFLAIGLAFFIYRNRQNIARQKAELEDLNRTKDRLLSIIAHDLRSPIGWLKDSFDLIDNNLSTPEKTQRFLSKSKERVERVYNTMENLLVWALAQRNGLVPRFESVPIAELVEEQIQNVTDFANRKTITLKNETPQYLKVWVDRNQMGIVFNNLLQNAIKFTPSGGTVVIYAEANDSQLFTLKVADTGIGMDVEIWKTMQKSQTLLSKQGTNKEKGTGLGLFLVKEIVDKNGGLFDIQSRKNIGTIASIGLKKG